MKILCDKKLFTNAPLVSVFCNAYNQEQYIEKCLDGFLMQKTSFPFEVLITDDASTDHTPDIIQSYVKRRPDLFYAVLHGTNQFSKGINHNRTYLFPRSRGRYIAFCEGDDYWTDSHKLQRQYEAMEAHPSATWCVHASTNVDANTGKVLSTSRAFNKDCILQFKDTGTKVQLAATASFFVRREVYSAYLDAAPSQVLCHGDFKMSRFFSLMGETIYLSDAMSAYRVLAANSINSSIFHSEDWRAILMRNTLNRVDYLKALDDWSGHSHSEEIKKQIDQMEYLGCLDTKDYKALLDRWPEQFKNEPFSVRLKVLILGSHPRLNDALRSIKLKFSHN